MEISCIDLGGIRCSYGQTEKGLVYLVNKKNPLTEDELSSLKEKYGAHAYYDFTDPKYRKGRYLLEVAEARKPILIKDSQGYCVIPLLLANGVTPFGIVANMPRYISENLEPFFAEHPKWKLFLRGQELTYENINLFQNCLGKQEMSCGAVVFQDRKVLIEHMVQKHISIPKGHIEPEDASHFATAYREVKEETGLEIKRYSEATYKIVYSPFEGIAKRVLFFLAQPIGGNEIVQESEVSSIEWIDIDEAIEKVTYETDKKVLRWAKRTLKL